LTVSKAHPTIVIASGERSDPSKPGKLEFVKTNLAVSIAYNALVIASDERSDPSKPGTLEFVKVKTEVP